MPSKFHSEFFQRSSDLLCIVNFKGDFVDINARGLEMLGWSSEELFSKPYAEFIHPEDREATKKEADKLATDADVLLNYENRLLTKSGNYIRIQWNVRQFRDENVLLCSGRDVTEAKNKELLLQIQHDRLELTQKIAHFGTWEFDLATGKIYWSKEVFQIHGLEGREEPPPFEELLGYFAPASRDRLVAAVNNTIQNGVPYGFRVELLLPGGGVRQAYAGGVPLKDASGKTIKLHGTLADMSETAQQEIELMAKNKELVEAQNRIADLVKFVPVGIFQTDLNGKCTFVNPTWSSLTGLDFAAAKGDGWIKALHPEDVTPVFEEWKNSVAEKREFNLTYRFQRPDGSEVTVHGKSTSLRCSEGEEVGYLGAVVDISQLKQAEANNALYRAALDKAAIVAFTDAQGRITYANDLFCKISEYSLQELMGQNHKILNSGFHEKEFFQKLWKDISSGKTWQGEICNRTKSGRIYWVSTTIVPLLDSKGKVDKYIAIRHDITKDKENQKKVIHTSKMSSLGEMSSGIAHEINNPLAIIMGKATALMTMAKRGDLENTKLIDGLGRIVVTVDRISKIIHSLRSFSRNAENDPMKTESVKQIITDTLELCGEKFKVNSINLEVAEFEDLKISCRASQISQVVLNLLNNAFDAVSGKEGAWVRLAVEKRGELVVISVTDSGLGIPPAVAEKMLEPFFTTKEIGKGTGLGLSISKGLIDSHGGKFKYISTSPNTRFEITLPAV